MTFPDPLPMERLRPLTGADAQVMFADLHVRIAFDYDGYLTVRGALESASGPLPKVLAPHLVVTPRGQVHAIYGRDDLN